MSHPIRDFLAQAFPLVVTLLIVGIMLHGKLKE